MNQERFVEDSRKDLGLNDDEIYNLVKALTPGKVTPEKLGVDVVQLEEEDRSKIGTVRTDRSRWQKEFQQQKNKTQKIDPKYQKLMRPRLRKSVERMVQEYEANVKKANELDSKIKQIDEKNQKLMKPVTITKFDKALKGAARS